eukprot:g29588.t2
MLLNLRSIVPRSTHWNTMSSGYGGLNEIRSSGGSLTAYEKKMMRRLEKANLAQSNQAPKEMPQAQALPKVPQVAPPTVAPGNPDHERLIALARESRQQGNLFFYFPDANERLVGFGFLILYALKANCPRIKQQAKEVHEQMKDREAMDENLRLRNEDLRWFLRMDSQHAEAAATLKNSEHEAPPDSKVRALRAPAGTAECQAAKPVKVMESFRANEVDGAILLHLTQENIRIELQVRSLNARKILWDRVSELQYLEGSRLLKKVVKMQLECSEDDLQHTVQAKLLALNKLGIWTKGPHPLDESALSALMQIEPVQSSEYSFSRIYSV